ncbi:type VI secretion system baseplate subunit TssK [uncultured Cohaesibacter sp.]|uniref:type VI secretion system baseplate subunit TssK n=1 Tax=uncultured Cohaesibacter sp. TaxID=1002546 RepID=UPI0029C99634|nr:type VI secretion system baseplate subunit TssK [uncultured Cohaesibacter sp.]
MFTTGKPLWLEGMFLRPQHLQQQDRWIESGLEHRVAGLVPFPWGIRDLAFDAAALGLGQIKLSAFDLIFPDGSVCDDKTGTPGPKARQITLEDQGKKVYLAIAMHSLGHSELSDNENPSRRYLKVSSNLSDTIESGRPEQDILLGALNMRILLEGESLDDEVSLQIAEIDTVDAQGKITLVESFIPPLLRSGASKRFLSILEEIRGLLRLRSQSLASAVMGQGGDNRSGMLDLMLLGAVNRNELVFSHMIEAGYHSCEEIYRNCIGMVGELSAYAASNRRSKDMPKYVHTDLRGTFAPILAELRNLLSVIVEQNAVSIPLTERGYGIWIGEIEDRMTLLDRRVVLIAQANVALETIRQRLPIQAKIGPAEQIKDLVNLQLPGISIAPLSVAPREIPFIQNAVYFELDSKNALWAQMVESVAAAIHVSGDYPGLNLELWAIQKGTAK